LIKSDTKDISILQKISILIDYWTEWTVLDEYFLVLCLPDDI